MFGLVHTLFFFFHKYPVSHNSGEYHRLDQGQDITYQSRFEDDRKWIVGVGVLSPEVIKSCPVLLVCMSLHLVCRCRQGSKTDVPQVYDW